MKILIDECLPRKLKNTLLQHEVKTVPEMGWAGKKNGELLRLMAKQFDVFITIDGNLPSQQNLAELGVALVILKANDNTFATLAPLMRLAVADELEHLKAGDIRFFS